MAINHAKVEAWGGVLDDSSNTGDNRTLWRIIKLLNTTPENNSPNDVMIHNDRCITSDKIKADILIFFIKHEAVVCNIGISMEEWAKNRNLKMSFHKLRGDTLWKMIWGRP